MQGGKLSEVAKMLSDFTDGILNGRFDVYNVVNRLKKKNMVVNIETGQKMVEFNGVQVALFDMPNLNRFNILSISIFCEIALSISISISIFSKITILISISIFLELPYRYRYFQK